jgi:dTMP kinase
MRRAAARRGADGADRFEAEALSFHEKLRDGFLTLAANEPGRCVLIDATLPKDEVAEQIWRVVAKRLDPATAPIVFEDAAAG